METFRVLEEYVNRQVVLNVYRGDELLHRDGFSFERILVESRSVKFVRGEETVVKLAPEPSAALSRLSGFPRYYAYEQDGVRTELYFP